MFQATDADNIGNFSYDSDFIKIGVQKVANARYFNGSIDEVMVYNRSLSGAEILDLYTYGGQKFSPSRGGPVCSWNFNGGMVNATHVRGSQYPYDETICDGSITNAIHVNESIEGDGMSFDGDGDYITVDDDGANWGSTLCNLNGCSMELWFNTINPPISSTYRQQMFARQDSTGNNRFFIIGIKEGNLISSSFNNDGISGSSADVEGAWSGNSNEWNHLIVVYNGSSSTSGNALMYLNGVLLSTSAASMQINATAWQDSEDVMIGAYDDGTHIQGWNGTLDDVRIFNYALTAAEIQAEYNRTYLLHPNERAEGDFWRANVTYVSSSDNESTALSTNNGIVNYLPKIDSMTIVEQTYITSDDIIAFGLATDSDNDPITVQVEWKNGTVSVQTQTIYAADSFEIDGDGWSCPGGRYTDWATEGSYHCMANQNDMTRTVTVSANEIMVYDLNMYAQKTIKFNVKVNSTTVKEYNLGTYYNEVINLSQYTNNSAVITFDGTNNLGVTYAYARIDNVRFIRIGDTSSTTGRIRNNTNISTMLLDNFTGHFDNLNATITLYDPFEFNLTTATSNNVSVSNSAPTIARASLNRFYDGDHDNENISGSDGTLATCTDIDGDLMTGRLYINGTPNGTINTSVISGEAWNVSSDLTEDGIYTWVLECDDDFDAINSSAYTFILDMTSPNIIYNSSTPISPQNTTAINTQVNQSIPINISLTDNHGLFAYNYSIYAPNGSIIFSLQAINLSGNDQQLFQNITPEINLTNFTAGEYIQSVWVEDDHTAKEILPAKSILKDPVRNRLSYNLKEDRDIDINLKSASRPILDYDTVKETDRYRFSFQFSDPLGETKKEAKDIETKNKAPPQKQGYERQISGFGPKEDWPLQTYTYTLQTSAPLFYRPSSDYPAHFVTWSNGSGEWIDFALNTTEAVNYSIQSLDAYSAEITITTTETELIFESLGGLNTQEENSTFNITVNEDPTLSNLNRDPTAPYTNQSIVYNVTYTDLENNTGTIFWQVLRDNISILNVTNSSIAANTTVFFSLDSTYFNKSQTINITVNATDSMGGQSNFLSDQVTILNSIPQRPTLTAPANNSEDIDGTITLGFSSSDTDGDDLTYYIYFDDTLHGFTTFDHYELTTYVLGIHNWSIFASDGEVNSSRSGYSYVNYVGTRGTAAGGGQGGSSYSSDDDPITLSEENQPLETSTVTGDAGIAVKKADTIWLTTKIVDLIVTTTLDQEPSYLEKVWIELKQDNEVLVTQDLIRDETLIGHYSFARTAKDLPIGTYTASVKASIGNANVAQDLGSIDVITPANKGEELFYEGYDRGKSFFKSKNGPLIIAGGALGILVVILITVLIYAATRDNTPDWGE